jgi:dipeptidyl-peptidase 4
MSTRTPSLRLAILLVTIVLVSSQMPAIVLGQATTHSTIKSRASGHANYELAARFAPYKIQKMIYSTSVRPNWIENSEKFWYEWKTSDGTFYYIVDPVRGAKKQVFDNDRIAAELTRITRDPWDGKHLPIKKIKFIDENTIRFDVTSSVDEKKDDEGDEGQEEKKDKKKDKPKKKVFHFEYNVQTRVLRELEDWEEPPNHPSWASISPDGSRIVFARNHNLFSMDADAYEKIIDIRRGLKGDKADEASDTLTVDEVQLTTDGEKDYSFARGNYGDTDNEVEKTKDDRKRVSISWSRDSNRFSVTREDERKSGELWVIHSVDNKRPELESYKYDMPGDKNVAQSELLVFDFKADSMTVMKTERFTDQSISTFSARRFIYPDSDEPWRSLWLSESPDKVYYQRASRDLKRIDVVVADAVTGESTTLIEERLNTYLETQRLELLGNGDFIWWSERDGWGHLYRFGPDGKLKNRLTKGPWSVRRVLGIDEKSGVVYFLANGREDGEDPYYSHVYRVNLDGTNLRLLDPGDFDHRASVGASNRYFVDNYSRVNTIPTAVLYSAEGKKVLDLEKADFSRLMEAGYQFPEPYKVKAADGITDLYGVIYRPFDFDDSRNYPIVEYVYPGPQTEAVAKSFSTTRYETALAQFGMIVVTVGNRGGNPARSKWYHNYGYGNLRDYGLADKKAAVEQLAQRYDYIDIDRVGIYGHSGGGFMSTAAMLVYPDFFKVAVSSSGNHTNNIYNRWWSEKHHGVKEVVSDSGKVSFEYSIDKNPDLAKNLKGHLLLTTGDMDNNVHPANTYRMAQALIKANKRFDFFIFPGQRHGYGNMSNYWFWLRAEYFVKHLLGDTRWQVNINQLNMEKEQNRRP